LTLALRATFFFDEAALGPLGGLPFGFFARLAIAVSSHRGFASAQRLDLPRPCDWAPALQVRNHFPTA